MNITQHIQKWGNGTGLRIPKKVLEAAGWHDGQSFTIDVSGESIVLSPFEDQKRVTLKELLSGVTPQSVGGEYKWGVDRGNEIIDG
jgi:antitoxin MazE